MDNSNKRTKPSRPNSYTQYPDFRYHKTDWDKNRPTQEYFDELFRVSKIQIVWGANYFCEYLPSGNGWILIYLNFAKRGDLILDTHLGSQASRIAAHKAGLSFVGFETDEIYYEKGEARFKRFIAQLRLF